MSEAIDIIIAQLVKRKRKHPWNITKTIGDVPETTGHFALYDGIETRHVGVTYNMRASILSSAWFGFCEVPIFMWLPDDADESAALWLRGKERCKKCGGVRDIGKRHGCKGKVAA